MKAKSREEVAGLDGLIPGRRSRHRRILPEEQVCEKILPLIEDPSLAAESHWNAVKLHGWIAQSSEQLQDRIIKSLLSLFDQPSILQSQYRPKTRL
jgi:hypothetical protein